MIHETIFDMYCRTKKLIDDAESCPKGTHHTADMLEMLQGWRESNEVIETAYPDVKDMFRRRMEMINSFTCEQKDHICYQIGDWYIRWQDKMWVDGKPNQHWLGVAKEQLKTMICGE